MTKADQQSKESQREEHFRTIKIQAVDNGYIVRSPLAGVKIFLTLEEVFDYTKLFFKGQKG